MSRDHRPSAEPAPSEQRPSRRRAGFTTINIPGRRRSVTADGGARPLVGQLEYEVWYALVAT